MELIKQEQALPVLRRPVSGELEQALSSALIRNATQEQIKEVLRLIMIKIGLRAQNWPTDEEKLVLIEHIVNAFGGHTIKEIKLAFDMAIAGRLETTNNKDEIITLDPNCYENFSCLYFSNIINAYRQWAKNEIKQLPIVRQLPAPAKEEKMTDDEFIEMNFKTWKQRPQLGTSTLAYEALERMGKIKLTKEEKKQRYEQAEAALKGRMASDNNWHDELQKIYTSLNPDHWRERVRNECRRIEVENYFKTL